MKPTKAILAFIILAAIILLSSCTGPKDLLLYPSSDTRRVVGYKYTKKNIYYLVVDGHGHKSQPIRECSDTIRPIGTIFFLKDEFKLCGTD